MSRVEPVTLSVNGIERRYLFHVPHLKSDPATRPVVIFLHGTGGTAAWADDETGWSAFADRKGFLLALPDGLSPNPERPPKFLTNPQRWNDGSPNCSTADDVAFLTAVIEDAIARGADRERVYLSGFSNGAGMAFRFAAERADWLAAIAPAAGYCWMGDPRPARSVPTLYAVGTADPLVPLLGGTVRLPWGNRRVERPPVADTLAKWALAIRREPESTEEAEFRVEYVEGLGHHWPGGKGQFDARMAGPPSDRVSGNELVWDFFRRHRLR